MKRINKILKNSRGIRKTAQTALVCKKAEKIIRKKLKTKQIGVVKYQNKNLFLKPKNPKIAQTAFENKEIIKKEIKDKLNIDLNRISFR